MTTTRITHLGGPTALIEIEQEFQHAPADIGRRLQWLPIGASTTIAG
jgi:hypothetical protein